VAVSRTGTSTDRIMTSPDGINWTIRTSTADNNWHGVTYGNGLFVAVSSTGTGNRIMTSGKSLESLIQPNNIYQGGMNIFGNVGIGTTTPTKPLTVLGDTLIKKTSTTSLDIQNDGGTSAFAINTSTNTATGEATTKTGAENKILVDNVPVKVTPTFTTGTYVLNTEFSQVYRIGKLLYFNLRVEVTKITTAGTGDIALQLPGYVISSTFRGNAFLIRANNISTTNDQIYAVPLSATPNTNFVFFKNNFADAVGTKLKYTDLVVGSILSLTGTIILA
jgi:hypothetical protein